MHDHQLRHELEALARRLERVERLLQLETHPTVAVVPPPVAPLITPPNAELISRLIAEKPAPMAVPVVHAPVAPPVAHIAPPIVQTSATPVVIHAAGPTQRAETFHRLPTRESEVQRAADAKVIAPLSTRPPLAPPSLRATSKPLTTEGVSLEFLIGGKWMAWVGALVVVVAAGFAVKVGIDRGWWGNLPPAMRCLLIAGFGGLLILSGEIALRRLGRAASVGLFGAGLGVMYLDAFATFRYFKIVSPEWAFVLMAGVAIIGFALTLRTRFLTIGVLSIVGGYLTPILLHGASTHDMELLMFLTMLLGISLALAAAMPRDFHVLRYVALGGQLFIGFGWLVANTAQWQLGIVFMSIWWSMVLGEAVLAAMRRIAPIGNPVMVLISTACYVTGGCWILNQAPGAASDWLGVFTGMIAVLGGAVAMNFGPGLDALRLPPRQAIDKLAVVLWAQSGVLIAATVALQFDGFAESIGWLAVGLAAVECGRRLPSRGVSIFGMVVLSLAITRVMLFDWWPRNMQATLTAFGDVTINRWSLLALVAMLVVHAAAHRLRAKANAVWPILLAVVGTFIWVALCESQCEGLSATAGWLLGCVILLALEKFGRRQRYFEIGLLMLSLTAARWLALDAVLHRVQPGWNAKESLPVLNWQMGMAVLIALVGWWTYRLMRTREILMDAATSVVKASWQWVLLAGAVFGMIALSFEIDRYVERLAIARAPIWWSISHLRQLLLTLLWTVGSSGVGLLALAMRSRDAEGRLRLPRFLVGFAWMVLGMCAVKWLFADTLYWMVVGPRSQFTGSLPLANVQMLVGMLLAASAIVLTSTGSTLFGRSVIPAKAGIHSGAGTHLDSRLRGNDDTLDVAFDPTPWLPVASALLLLWGLSFEVDRAISRIDPLPVWMAVWDHGPLRALFLTGLWAIGGVVMLHIGRWRNSRDMIGTGWSLTALAACLWLTFDTLAFRFANGLTRASLVFNLQTMIGLLVAALLLHASVVILRRSRTGPVKTQGEMLPAAHLGFGLVAAMVLLLGSLEIDRFFADKPMSRQTGFSVWWAIFGLLLVLLGFAKVTAVARYAGLGLLSFTLVKVLLVDFSALDDFPRVISTAAAGLLFIVTSLVYTKLSPKILALREKASAAESGS